MNSRRQFIQRCSGALLCTAATPIFGALVSGVSSAAPGLATFSPHLGSAFKLITDSRKVVPVKLSRIDSYEPSRIANTSPADNFSLRFTADSAEVLEQGTYGFQHPELGMIDLFVVPGKSHAEGATDYVAIFHNSPVRA